MSVMCAKNEDVIDMINEELDAGIFNEPRGAATITASVVLG